MSSQQVEDKEAAAIELNKSSQYYKWSSKFLELSLTFVTFEPFAAHKYENYSQRQPVGGPQKLWLTISIPISAYLSIKPLIVLLLRWLRKILSAHKSGQVYSTVHIVNWLLTLTGDPIASIPFTVLFNYFYFPFCVLWMRCYLPLYLRHIKPLESSFARFLMEPQQEIDCFDLCAFRMLKSVVNSFENCPMPREFSLRGAQAVRANLGDRIEWIGRETQQQLDGMNDIKRRISQIRPKSLKADWHRSSYQINLIVLVTSMATDSSMSWAVTLYFIHFCWQRRCSLQLTSVHLASGQLESTNCSLSDVFSPSDLLMIFELLLLVNVFFIMSANVRLVLHMLQVRHQLYLTEDIMDITRTLVDELHGWQFRGQLRVKLRGLSEQLSGRLCANIIAMWMFQRETRKCLRMLAHTTRFAIINCLVLTAVTFASLATQRSLARVGSSPSHTKTEDATFAAGTLDLSMAIMLISWLIIWCQTNVLLVSCAIIPSKISRLSRLVYSLMAQLIRLQMERRTLYELRLLSVRDDRIPLDDPITSLWRRIAHSEDYVAEKLAVHAFTNKLTFGRVLGINFYVASIISLITIHI